MISRALGASGRAIIVFAVVTAPGLFIPSVSADSTQFAALIAVFAGILTLFEYSSPTPVMVEFRHAPPYNKIRLAMLLVLVSSLTVLVIGAMTYSAMPNTFFAVGLWLGNLLDLPASPVRLMRLMMPQGMSPESLDLMRAATGLSFTLGLLMLIATLLYFRGLGWPSRKLAFNVHTNLPMFDPTAGGDVVVRLRRGARTNILVGAAVPFIIPACLHIFAPQIEGATFMNMQTLVWFVALWVFLPLNLCLRGIVMGMLVELIEEKRRQRYSEIQEDGLLA